MYSAWNNESDFLRRSLDAHPLGLADHVPGAVTDVVVPASVDDRAREADPEVVTDVTVQGAAIVVLAAEAPQDVVGQKRPAGTAPGNS